MPKLTLGSRAYTGGGGRGEGANIFRNNAFFVLICVPLKYLILMPDIKEAKCFEFTVQIFESVLK